MDIILSASIIAAFVAGTIALFAPCCITVLLPAYLASAFREKRRLLRMTLVFFAGIAVVLIPIGLGAASLAQLFRNFHAQMYVLGGAFMIVLGALSLMGKNMEMVPFLKRFKPDMQKAHAKSVFGLGILSGAATSCCAPVLAGAMTLAIVSGAFWKAILVTFAYVFGMTFPLFVAAYCYDRFKLERSRLIRGRMFEFGAGGRRFSIHSTNLIAGIIFIGMGLLMLGLGASGSAFWSPEYQAHLGTSLGTWSQRALETASAVPEIIWGMIILACFIFFVIRTRKDRGDDTIMHCDHHTKDNKHHAEDNDEKTPRMPTITPGICLLFVAIGIVSLLGFLGTKQKSRDGFASLREAQEFIRLAEQRLEGEVLPVEGVTLPIAWSDLGAQMISAGVIDQEKYLALSEQRGGLSDEHRRMLTGSISGPLIMTKENSAELLNLLWAFGLSNKNAILEQGPMKKNGDARNYASTGGWPLSKGDVMDHYSMHAFVVLSPDQQSLVERVSQNIYRPCCGNSVHFPDCNHGMAMLGLLELMAANGVSEEEMYDVALTVNSFWFPQTYVTLAKYFEMRGVSWDAVDAKEMLGSAYSSAMGYRNILAEVEPAAGTSGQGCGA